MRTSFDMEAHQGTYRLRCALCGREWHDSIVGKCPEREIHVCMYCCRRLCDKSYTLPGQIGQRCRAKDRAREEKRGGRRTGDPSSAPSGHLPPGEGGDGRRGTIAPSVASGDSSTARPLQAAGPLARTDLPEGAGDGSAAAGRGTPHPALRATFSQEKAGAGDAEETGDEGRKEMTE